MLSWVYAYTSYIFFAPIASGAFCSFRVGGIILLNGGLGGCNNAGKIILYHFGSCCHFLVCDTGFIHVGAFLSHIQFYGLVEGVGDGSDSVLVCVLDYSDCFQCVGCCSLFLYYRYKSDADKVTREDFHGLENKLDVLTASIDSLVKAIKDGRMDRSGNSKPE